MRLKKKKAVVNFLAPCSAEIGLTHTNCALQIIFVIYFCLSMLGEILIFYSLSITELVSYSFFFLTFQRMLVMARNLCSPATMITTIQRAKILMTR